MLSHCLFLLLYNEYIDTYIKPFTGVMCGPSPDGGIMALKLPGAFSFSQFTNQSKDKTHTEYIMKRRKISVSEPYGGVTRRNTNFTDEILASAQDLMHCWQLCNWIVPQQGTGPVDNETLSKLRIFGRTQVFIPDDVNKGTSLVILAIENALLNIRARNGDMTISDSLLKEFAMLGDGSILPLAEALLTGGKIIGSLLGRFTKGGSMGAVF